MNQKKSPRQEAIPRKVSITGTLSKQPIKISDGEYIIGCAIQTTKTQFIGCRLKGLEAATIQLFKVGTRLTLTGITAKRDNGRGKLVKCFCVTGLRLSS